MSQQSVFVTGANGYIGLAVCRAFVSAGWRVFGLIRRPEAAAELYSAEVVPILGTFDDLSSLSELYKHVKSVDVIVGATEVFPNYGEHYLQVNQYIRSLAKVSNDHGVRPLVLWTSGCKDYGNTGVDGSPSLVPHTEDCPATPSVAFLQQRATFSLKIFENTDLFDAAVLRPTNVYGRSSSHYGRWFEVAQELKTTGAELKLTIDPKSILHAMHVDDCGEAYVALAEHSDRSQVAGQCFNISAHAYETSEAVWRALEREYGIEGKVQFVQESDVAEPTPFSLAGVFGYSQWVSSVKLRKLTGWKDRRMLFTENLPVYRKAYEVAVATKADDIARADLTKAFLDTQ
ncbi:hypothetical protein PFICI_12028 [Pestalotiopsis fici W106-1]|uniref:NAD-dependent epimerase/dehydratase domain-containing protein n=1 Tax=Pestalotiopsis fici (strain W106-1 / CGMCC3.15140) TaxID=1229662 RepID=W3WUV7_PESFW|nr:uncharacterized protein PFICI_12028 [Pestalotiopsis fici W106-1]ETS76641.1 hypothetical protein PFICI_12028 [Pestalotiopsis fici W106-1]